MGGEPADWFMQFDDQPLPKLQADVMQRWQRSQYRKHWHERVSKELTLPPPQPLAYAAIRGTRHSSAQPDRINVWNSFKALVDGLIAKHAGLILDDNPNVLIHETYDWEKAPPNHGFVTLEVWALEGQGDPCPWALGELVE